MSNKRIHYIDIAKGIAIILVILGHNKKWVSPNIVWWLYTFHMPLFFILSGMVFKPEKYDTFKEFFLRKTKTLLIPYFLLSLIALIWIYIVRNPADFINHKTLNALVGIIFCKRNTPYYFTMWFIPMLYVSEIITFLLYKVFKNKKAFLYITFIIGMVFGTLIINRHSPFVWNIDVSPIAMSFIVFGYWLKTIYKEENITTKQSIVIALLLLAINIVIGYINFVKFGKLDLYETNLGNPALFYISAISGSLFVIIACSKILKESKILEYIGRNSLIYYAYQQVFFIKFFRIIAKTLAREFRGIFINTNMQLLIILAGTCISLAIVSEIINKCFPFVVGKINYNKYKKKYS